MSSPNQHNPDNNQGLPTKLKFSYRDWYDKQGWSYLPFNQTLFGKLVEKSLIILTSIVLFTQSLVIRSIKHLFKNIWKIIFRATFLLFAFIIITEQEIKFSIHSPTPVHALFNNSISLPPVTSVSRKVTFIPPKPPASGAAQTEKNRGMAPAEQSMQPEAIKSYIKRFSRLAVVEMGKFGIPASVMLSVGLIESKAGMHPNVAQSKNHFGSFLANKSYKNDWENWRQFSLKLKKEHPEFFEHGLNYQNWLEALKNGGFFKETSTDQQALELIETYHLDILDEI